MLLIVNLSSISSIKFESETQSIKGSDFATQKICCSSA